jgi:hypothetical protein
MQCKYVIENKTSYVVMNESINPGSPKFPDFIMNE